MNATATDACDAFTPPGPMFAFWNVSSLVLTIVIVLSALVRTVLATVAFLFMPKARVVVQALQLSSAAASLLAALAALLVEWWLDLNDRNAVYYIFFISEFMYFLLYDLWLIFRDRALQCAYFITPKCFIWIVGALIAITFIVMVAGLQMFSVDSEYALGVLFFAGIFLLQLMILVIMTWLFARPLGANFGVAEGLNMPGFDALREVVVRTAVGSVLHIFTSVMYIIMLLLWSRGHLCSISRASVYYLSTLGFTLHLNISHRDDLSVRKLFFVAYSRVSKRLSGQSSTTASEPVGTDVTLTVSSSASEPHKTKARGALTAYAVSLAYEETALVKSAPKRKREKAEARWEAAATASAPEQQRNNEAGRTLSLIGSEASGNSFIANQLISQEPPVSLNDTSIPGQHEYLELTPTNSLCEEGGESHTAVLRHDLPGVDV